MNLEEEVRRGYTIPVEMKKVWKVQMDLLKKLLEVCEKHHLHIWAEGGTLLGAVREHGYIPWDDDIDMAMLREDYDRLVEIAPNEFNHPYFFQCGYTETVYPRGHAQLRMDGTTAILPMPAFVNTHQGIFIDIFPYDYMPNGEMEMKELIDKRDAAIARLYRMTSFDVFHPFRSIRFFYLRRSFHDEYKKFEDIFRCYHPEDCNKVCCLTFVVDTDHYLRDKSWYSNTFLFPFEDIQLPVPSGYHEILTKQYGDYMTPRQEATYHGAFWKLDPATPYEEYLPELKKHFSSVLRERRLKRIKSFVNKVFHKSQS